jgi:hypothetical protein
MTPRIAALLVAAALAAPAAGLAQAGPNAQLVAAGRQQFDDLRYEEAVQTLSAALLRRGNTAEQEVAIYELLALSYLALNRDEESEGAFRLMLARDPGHALGASQAPRIRDFFQGVAERWRREAPAAAPPGEGARAERPVTIDHRSPAQQTAGVALTLTAQITDPDRRAEALVLAYRPGSRGLFRRLRTHRSAGVFSATVPPEEVRAPVVEYYLEAVDPRGIAVSSRGDAFAPLRVVVPRAEATPITARWWFWTGAAAVVAAVAVGTYFAVSGSSEPEPARLTITVRGE